MNPKRLYSYVQPDPPDPDGNYTDSVDHDDDESATCPEDYDS